MVEFYVQSRDTGGHTRTWPAPTDNFGGQGANALYQVDNTPAVNHSDQPLYLIITTAAQWNAWTNLQDNVGNGQYANSQMNATWITLDGTGTEVHYVCGVRNRGAGTRAVHPHNFQVNIPSDHPWEHLTRIELNTNYTESQMAGNAVLSAAGLLNTYGAPVQVNVNGSNLASSGANQYGSYYAFVPYDSEWTAAHTPDDSNGDIYKGVWHNDNATLTYPANLANHGTDLTKYRLVYGPSGPTASVGGYSKETNSSQDDWSDLINLVTVLNATYTSDDAYYQAVSKVVNIDEWVKYLAVNALLDNAETTFETGAGDDYSLFCGAVDHRFQLIPHDLDTVLNEGDTHPSASLSIFVAADGSGGSPSTPGIAAMNAFLRNSLIAPKYYAALEQLATTIFSATQFNALMDRVLGGWVSASTIQNMETFAAARVTGVLAQIPTTLTANSAETVQSGYPRTTNGTTSLTGKFDVTSNTASIKVNGVTLPISDLKTAPAAPYMRPWAGDWAASNIVLTPGLNRIVIQALDASGTEIQRTSIDVWRDTGSMTTVAGQTLSANTTWTSAGGPYHVTGNINVPNGVTLTIQAGTTVYCDNGVGFTINGSGKLVAQGTDYQRIRFTQIPGTTSGWAGFTYNTTTQANLISYADIQYGGSGSQYVTINGTLNGTSAQATFDHDTFGGTNKLYFNVYYPQVTISHCTFADLGGNYFVMAWGINTDGWFNIDSNVFGHNSGDVDILHLDRVSRKGGPSTYVTNNIFTGAGDDIVDDNETDTYIVGNYLTHADIQNTGRSSSAAITTGPGAVSGMPQNTTSQHLVVVGNVFYANDYGPLLKKQAGGEFYNDVFVGNIGAMELDEPGGSDTGMAGRYAYIDSCIFWNNGPETDSGGQADQGGVQWGSGTFVKLVPAPGSDPAHTRLASDGYTQLVVNNSILPAMYTSKGTGNIAADPRFVNPTAPNASGLDASLPDFSTGCAGYANTSSFLAGNGYIPDVHLAADSPARGTASNGYDMGIYVAHGGRDHLGGPDLAYLADLSHAHRRRRRRLRLQVSGPGTRPERHLEHGKGPREMGHAGRLGRHNHRHHHRSQPRLCQRRRDPDLRRLRSRYPGLRRHVHDFQCDPKHLQLHGSSRDGRRRAGRQHDPVGHLVRQARVDPLDRSEQRHVYRRGDQAERRGGVARFQQPDHRHLGGQHGPGPARADQRGPGR